jgi:hypothetical protein
MDPVQIYYLFQQHPFPFRIYLRDGRNYDIRTRRFVVVGVTFLDIGFQADNAPEGVWGPTTTIPLQDISRIESLASPSSLPTNE